MSTEPEAQMNPRLRSRVTQGTKELLEPGESVLGAVPNMTMPWGIYLAFLGGILLVPYVLQKSSVAVLTERHVYVFKTGLGYSAKQVLFKAPRGAYEARLGGAAFPGRYVVVGDQKIWFAANAKIRANAEAIVAAGSAGGQDG